LQIAILKRRTLFSAIRFARSFLHNTPIRDHLTTDAQDLLIHDRYSHVPAIALAAQELQEWLLNDRSIMSVSKQVRDDCYHIIIMNPNNFLS
jgi:hypothetical protein